VREGQILLRVDLGTAKYLASGRNIGQQEAKLAQPKAIRDVLRLLRLPPFF